MFKSRNRKLFLSILLCICAALFACGIFAILNNNREQTVTVQATVTRCNLSCETVTLSNRTVSTYGTCMNGNHRWYVTCVNPTCTKEGRETKTCEICGYVVDIVIPPTDRHTYSDVVTPPTCTAQGYTTRTCSVCGKVVTDSYTDVKPHPYQIVVTAPTCTSQGYTTRTCPDCGKVVTDTYTNSVPHKYTPVGTVQPTCTAQGYTLYTCSVCKTSYRDNYTNALDHDWGAWTVIKAATEQEEGEQQRKCQRAGCNVTEKEAIPKLEHVHVWNEGVVTKDSTCTVTGIKTFTCTTCNETKTEDIEMKPHSYGEWELVTAATCKEGGSEKRVCGVCNYEKTRNTEIDPDAHDIVHHEAQAATCTEKGWNAYDTCTRCDYSTYSELAIDPNAHDLVHHDAQAATCLAVGWNAYDTCSRCDYTTYEGIPILPHQYSTDWSSDGTGHWHECINGCNEKGDFAAHTAGEWITDKQQNCTEDGSKHTECTTCGYETARETIPADGVTHNFSSEWKSDETGHWHECQNGCNEKNDFAAHTAGEWITDKQPNCTEDGSKHTECTACGYETARETIPADGVTHNYSAEWSSDGTGHWHACNNGCGEKKDYAAHSWGEEWDTDNAKHWHECTVCRAKKDEAAHTAGEWIDDKKATCTEDGSRHKVCTGCGQTMASETVAAKGHTLTPWQHDENAHWKQCSTCNEKVEEAGHNWSDWTITKQPTKEETGEKRCSCPICGQIKVETIAKLVESEGGNGNVSDLPVLDDPNSSYKLEITIKATDRIYADLAGKNKGYQVGLFIVNSQNDDKQEFNKQMEVNLSLIVPEGMEEFTLYRLVGGEYEVIAPEEYTVEAGVLSIRTTLPEEFIFNTKAAPAKSGGIPWWVWVIVGVGGVAIVAAIIVIIVVKKRKAVAEVQEYDDAELKAQLAEQNKRLEDLENRDDGGFGDIYDGDV